MSSGSIAITRLTEERKQWRKDHPFGFIAKPASNADGSANLLVWECSIPGKEGTVWEGGLYKLLLKFHDSYPASPPQCIFTPPPPHPNIFPSGAVCLSIVSYAWKPAITVKQILIGIQELLGDPNPKSPAHHDHYLMFRERKAQYEANARAFAQRYKQQ